MAAELKAEIGNIKKSYKSQGDQYSIFFLNNKYEDLLSSYGKVDKRADEVRRDLNKRIQTQRYGDWYCDAEYKRANIIKGEYNELSKKVKEIKREYSSKELIAKSAETSAKAKIDQINSLKKRIKDMEEKAKASQKIREEANAIRTEIQESFSKIDSKIAEKFMKEEYTALNNKIDVFIRKVDSSVKSGYKAIASEIENFNTGLQRKYNEYLEKKRVLEAELEALTGRINNKAYSDPEDEFKREDKRGAKRSLLQFLREFAKGKFVSDIESAVNNIKSALNNDNFPEAEKRLKAAEKIINEASDFAAAAHENKMKNITVMLAIRKAMYELKYDVKVTKNENSDDGYNIDCNLGDENIIFDRVTITDEGNPVIDIDHHESAKGNCANSWHVIRQRLAAENIFIEDIKKDGVSINSQSGQGKSWGGKISGTANG